VILPEVTQHILDRGGVTSGNELDEQARKAVNVFRSLQPTLSMYARSLSGNKNARVVLAAQDNGSTDGTNIYFRPPIALGDPTPHESRVCDQRGEDGRQLCHACQIREAVLVTIYHEIAHISYQSFERTTEFDKTQAIHFAIKEAKGKYADRIEKRIRNAPAYKLRDYLNLASLINPFLPTLVNCLEDARVNRALFAARPGVKKMFEADEAHIFDHGFEVKDNDGKVKIARWDTAALNSQVMIGCFCKAVGYDYSKWFHKKVVAALDDGILTDLIARMDRIDSMSQVYNLSFLVLARLRELGFLQSPEDKDEEEQEDSPSEDDADSGGGSGESGEDDQPDDSMGGGEGDSDAESSGSDGGVEGHRDESGSEDEEERAQDAGPSGDSDSGDDTSESADESDSSSVRSGTPDLGEGGDEESDSNGSQEGKRSPEDSDEPVDTGADDGYGGTQVLEDDGPTPEMGTHEEVEPLFQQWSGHDEKPKSVPAVKAEKAMDIAIIQGLYFTTPSKTVVGITEHHYDSRDDTAEGWPRKLYRRNGSESDIKVPDAVLRPSIMRTRRAFTDNALGDQLGNLKSGKVRSRVLGRRAWNNDERLFKKNLEPGEKSYYVQIGVDISYSTVGVNIALEKRAVWAQAEILQRVGIPFEIIAHSSDYVEGGTSMQIYHVKDANENWTDKLQVRLMELGPVSGNLDGHALEYLRKRAERSLATDKIIMYYSDGKMPAENKDEELVILQREIAYCKKVGITLMGVGIRTDSPRAHGLDTVQVDTDADLIKVVEHLGKRLSGTVGR
jgi:hypothetical protein